MADGFFPNDMENFVPETDDPSAGGAVSSSSLLKLFDLSYSKAAERFLLAALDLTEKVVKETWVRAGRRVKDFFFAFVFVFALTRAFLMVRCLRYARALHGRRSSPYMLLMAALLMVSAALLTLLAFGVVSLPVGFHGPRRATFLPDRGDGIGERGEQWTEVLSWEPRALLYHNFLSKEECEYLIELAKPHMEKSTVVDSSTVKCKDSRVRTCSGMFLRRGRDEVIQVIEKRIADFTFIPVEHGEGLQVLHYEVGQKYEPHFDYLLEEFNTKNGGQRIATVLMYLSDVEEGGETVFPSAKVNSSSLPGYNELSECGKRGLSVKPKMGDALLFWSMRPNATLDPSTLHGGCPVIKGNKWSCTKWMRVNEFKV